MIEVEVKARAPEDMAGRIASLGAALQAVENHHDLYFNGYLASFDAKAGLSLKDSIVFQEQVLGQAHVQYGVAKLSDARRALWVHAYIYSRRPSLTFIAVRAHEGARDGIEQYLATIQVQ